MKSSRQSNIFAGFLLVSDMDGTLLTTNKKVSPENLAALKHFVAGGGLFTIATGRIKAAAAPYLASLPVNAPAILYNGGVIYDFGRQQTLWDKTLPNWIKDFLPMISEHFQGIGVEVYTGDGAVYALTENEFTHRHQVHDNLQFRQDLDYRGKPWRKILFAWKPEQLARLESWLIREGMPLPAVRSEPQFLEILPENVNKGTALDVLTKYLKINYSQVLAIGDNLNDVEMLQRAGIGIAVANAHDNLKKVASLHCTHHDNHAMTEVVNWIERKLEPS